MNIAEEIKKKHKPVYVQVAEKFGVTPRFVGQIARGERKGLRGKGLLVKEELELLIN